MVLVPEGEFLMGSPEGDPVAEPDERPQHLVRLKRPFYLGAHEVTVRQFRTFVEETGYKTKAELDDKGGGVFNKKLNKIVLDPAVNWRNPGLPEPQSDDEPVVQVCCTDAFTFCEWLRKREEILYRLPTEAEWEYACRAGNPGQWCFGDELTRLRDYAWVVSNAGRRNHPVGQKEANAFGLHDMHGNVWEWCRDRYAPYSPEPVVDPRGPSAGPPEHLIRGGSWDEAERLKTRSAERVHHASGFRYLTVGFRVYRSFSAPDPAPRAP
jgi:formylglycine-generating enzyme required for sulfatase activity